jgi:hypothetical protein
MSKQPPPLPSKPSHLTSAPLTSTKRGIGWPWDYPASHFQLYTSLSASRITWLFNWELWRPPGTPASIEWVPCVRSAAQAKDVIPFLDDIINNQGVRVKYLLGFNEPEISDQANMSVEEAVMLWRDVVLPAKEKFGLRLGSPGVSSDVSRSKPWLDAFFGRLGETEAGVDFLVVHWYGHNFHDMRRFLEDMRRTYRLPLWVNEFACSKMGDGEAGVEDVESFINEAVPWLDGCEWVEKYAYYGNGQGKTVGGWVGKGSDFCEEGDGCEGSDGRRLTKVGDLYSSL